jgi:hypothetical protein
VYILCKQPPALLTISGTIGWKSLLVVLCQRKTKNRACRPS